jgi:hypothetical protein
MTLLILMFRGDFEAVSGVIDGDDEILVEP